MTSVQLADDEAGFYLAHGPFSDPDAFAFLYADLPADPSSLARIARDLVIHRMEGELFEHAIIPNRLHHDAETRYLDDILRLVIGRNPAPLTQRREAGDRFVGVCRDIALIYCSFLRHVGVPARVRCGFADYFDSPGVFGDHVVTEYWDHARGWLLADPQLADRTVTDAFAVVFDPMDVPRDRFLVAGSAWQAIRTGGADPMTFGHWHPDTPLAGEWFVAHSARLDLAALNKIETLLWDVWGMGVEQEMTNADRGLYDQVAHVTARDVHFASAQALFTQSDQLRTPPCVLSLAPFNGPDRVTLRG